MTSPAKEEKVSTDTIPFRYVPDIDSKDKENLKENGYYRGFSCPHNHVIRDIETHFCYHCVEKILSNNCGFNINFINEEYKVKYLQLWKRVDIIGWDSCWPIDTPTNRGNKRVCFPSYRSFYSGQKAENVSFHKAIYQCAWGDVGSTFVTHLCKNKNCANPLHLVSNWNRRSPPAAIFPFTTEFEAEQLMLFNRTKLQNSIQTLIRRDMKPTITHPLDVADNSEYNE